MTNILPIRDKMKKLIENTNSQNTMRFAFIFPKTQELSKGVVEFGTFDIETYSKSGNNKFIPYCAVAYFSSSYFSSFLGDSYITKLNRRNVTITDPLCIILFKIKEFMKSKGLKSVTLYAHNLSSFDGFFILKTCVSHKIKLNILKRDSKIYYLKVSIGKYKIEFKCSLLFLQASLSDCAQSFNVPMAKIPFNHD